MMKRTSLIVLACVCVLALGFGNLYAARGGQDNRISPSAVSRINASGDILGQVILDGGSCGVVSVSEALVYIPGHSFMVKPSADGMFRIYNVPAGHYDLVVEVPGFEPVFKQRGINVQAKMITNLTDTPAGQGHIAVTCVAP